MRRATRPGAAMMPAWRIAPPSERRTRFARSMKARVPASSGADRRRQPLRQADATPSRPICVRSRTSTPSATAALNTRAPSRCTAKPASCAAAARASVCAGVSTVPPAALCVFSRHTMPGAGNIVFALRTAQLHAVEIRRAVVSAHRHHEQAARRRDGAVLHPVEVRRLLDDGRRAGLGVRAQRHGVRHRSAHGQEGGLLAEHARRLGLEFEHGRIAVAGIVAEPRRDDALQHLGRRQRQGVTSQIDQGHEAPFA